MIHYINFQKLRNATFLQFIELLIILINSNDPAELKLIAPLAEFENLVKRASVQFLKPRRNKLNSILNALDIRRDQLFVGISQISTGYLKHWDSNYSASAKELTEDIKRYGAEIYNLNLQEKSAILEKLTKNWNADLSLTNALQVLHLHTWAIELGKTNAEYSEKCILRTKNEAAKSTDTFKKVREEMIATYKAFSKLLVAYETIDNTGKYLPLTAQINALIEQYNTIINSAKPRKGKDNEESDESDSSDNDGIE